MEPLMADVTSYTNPPPPPTVQIKIDSAARDQSTDVDLDNVINLLPGSYSTSTACPSSFQEQTSTDSKAVNLLNELKTLFQHPFKVLSSDELMQGKIKVILHELEPVKYHLPISCRGMYSTFKDFIESLSAKVPSFNRVISSYKKEALEKEAVLGQLKELKANRDRQYDPFAKGKDQEKLLNDDIVRLENELKRIKEELKKAKEKKGKLGKAMTSNLETQQRIKMIQK